jgi:two-component system chemotaxis response regulator CheB
MHAQHVENRRNIITIGASAGGIPAIEALLRGLPSTLDASLFIVLHLAPDTQTGIDGILRYYTKLPVTMVLDAHAIQPGHVYIAAPDHHLILEPECARSIRGPKENWFRPSVDVLFRSAALAFGPRVMGVVLSGMLDDGAAGLGAIKRRGGLTIVQDPADARFPMMPEAAMRAVDIDARLTAGEIAKLLMDETRKEVPSPDTFPVPKELELEVRIAKQELNPEKLLAAVESIGTRTILTCPECHGTLWEISGDGQQRYRCHIGHAYTEVALSAGQSTIVEEALWSAMRALEEKVVLARRLAERLQERGLERGAQHQRESAERLDGQARVIRELVLKTRDEQVQLEEDRV